MRGFCPDDIIHILMSGIRGHGVFSCVTICSGGIGDAMGSDRSRPQDCTVVLVGRLKLIA